MATLNLHTVSSPEHLQELLSKDLNAVSVLYFRADWAEPCAQMDAVLVELAKRWTGVLFLSVSRRLRTGSERGGGGGGGGPVARAGRRWWLGAWDEGFAKQVTRADHVERGLVD